MSNQENSRHAALLQFSSPAVLDRVYAGQARTARPSQMNARLREQRALAPEAISGTVQQLSIQWSGWVCNHTCGVVGSDSGGAMFGHQVVQKVEQHGPVTLIAPIEPKPMPKNAVFISYCRTDASGAPSRDQKAAIAIRDALEARNIDVWFDQRALEAGNDYESKIRRYIKTCSVFMPLVSETTEARREGYFRKEWEWAVDRLSYFTGSGHELVIPVVLDKVGFSNARVPEAFKPFQYVRFVDDSPPADLLAKVERLYRAVQAA